MSVKVGINGMGRIGKVALRAITEMGEPFEVVGLNIRNVEMDYIIYMLKYDTVFGRFNAELGTYDGGIIINGKKIPVFSESEADQIPWASVGAEYIIEATGAYLTTEKCEGHLKAGAKKVVISAPAKDDTPMFVYGVNNDQYKPEMKVVSAASCTTNCLAPMCKVLNDNWGIEQGLMSTVHASTSKQKTVDGKSPKDWRAARSVYGNIIPSTTGAAKAVGKVIPDVKGKMTGLSFRIPAADASVVDLNVMLKKPASLAEINAKMKEAAEGPLKDVLLYCDDEVVSSDFIGESHPSCYDARMGIELNDKFFKLLSFYDNEWGYTCNLIRLLGYMAEVDAK